MMYKIPDASRADELYLEPPAIQRHYLIIREAMKTGDLETIGNRQLRLLGGGFEIPITIEQCNKLLEKY